MPTQHTRASLLLGLLLFFSGAIALVYEVIWHRQFALLFGSGAPATAVVLAAYLAGMGLGSIVIGRWASRAAAPLIWYAALELVVAIGALLVAPLLGSYSNFYPQLVARAGETPVALLTARALLAFLAILLPTAAMGGTLPVLAQLVDRRKEHLGFSVGWLYLVNTAGAALGALLVPFALLPRLGADTTVLACACANVLIAVLAFWMRENWKDLPAPPKKSPVPRAEHSRRWLALAFISGAGMFAVQVLWNRAFAQVHQNSIYAFALVVTVFIAAIAVGTQIARHLLRRNVQVESAFGTAWLGGGIAIALSPVLFIKLTGGLAYTHASVGSLAGRALLLILPPIALLGTGLPLLIEKFGRAGEGSASAVTGRILAVNIAGAIVGALLGGFLLPKLVGTWNAMIAAGAAFAVAGACVLSGSRRILGLASVATVLLLAQISSLPRVRLEARGERLLAVEESAYGIVAVTERAMSRRLKLNNHYTLGGTAATGDERMQAHIPLLLHPQPRRVVFLGYGTGITAGGSLFHPGIDVTAVELVPEVAQLAANHFSEANRNFHSHSNASIIIADARNFLRTSSTKFDVIISDIVVPWQAGEAALYTYEHFAAARSSLAPDGIFCVWVPAFQLGKREFHILLRTFLSVFPSAQIWRGDFSPDRPALAFVASDHSLAESSLQRRLSEMTDDPANPHVKNARAFWMHFVGIIRNAGFTEQRINSEDRPWIELLAPSHGDNQFFIGRQLIEWQQTISKPPLFPSAHTGSVAGLLMVQFTNAMAENDSARAERTRAQLRELLGDEAFHLIFGPG